jgi:BMFP domain-containing protein YqiC
VVVKGEAPSANGKEDVIVLKVRLKWICFLGVFCSCHVVLCLVALTVDCNQVSLLAAGTQLEWEVLRSWKEFSQLHKDFKRYKSSMLSLPSKLLTTDRKRLQLWLDSVASSPALSSSKEFYQFLSIGKTVELLSAHHARPATRALEVGASAKTPAGSTSVAATAAPVVPDVTDDQEALQRALGNLELFIDDEASEVGSLRAHKKGADDGSGAAQLSAADIEKALQHLMGLQFTVSPLRNDNDSDADDPENQSSEGSNPHLGLVEDEEDDEEEASASLPREGQQGTVEFGASAFKEQLRGDTAELDLKALVVEQRQTIEEQRATIAQLEARIKLLEARFSQQQPFTKK